MPLYIYIRLYFLSVILYGYIVRLQYRWDNTIMSGLKLPGQLHNYKRIQDRAAQSGTLHLPLLSSCCWMCFNKRECIAVIFMNNVWTELSFAMLRPLLELDFIRLTKISTCVFKVVTNSSISVSVSPFSCRCCWQEKTSFQKSKPKTTIKHASFF